MASRVMEAVGFVEQSSRCESLEVGDYLKAIEVLDAMKLGFKDVEMLLFNPKLNSLPNLVGVQYCISWLGVPVCTNFAAGLMLVALLCPNLFVFHLELTQFRNNTSIHKYL